MKPAIFKLTEPEYRALRLKAEEAKRLRRAMQKARRIEAFAANQSGHDLSLCACLRCEPYHVLDRALARRKR